MPPFKLVDSRSKLGDGALDLWPLPRVVEMFWLSDRRSFAGPIIAEESITFAGNYEDQWESGGSIVIHAKKLTDIRRQRL